MIEWINRKRRPRNEKTSPFDDQDQNAEAAVHHVAIILGVITLSEAELETLWLKAGEMDSGKDGAYLAAPLYPALSDAFPDRSGELLGRLRRALLSDDEDEARQAAVGASRWVQSLTDRPNEHSLLADVVREIGLALARRRQVMLPPALDFAVWLFKRGPAQYRDFIADDCDFGLAALLEEASYDRTDQTFDVPTIRALAVALADAMNQSGYGNRKGVEGWLDAAAGDPLPEVRHAAMSRRL